ncbi:MAG: eukaryotic porin-domain-containing protein, partial [Olpidium bornovanus]
SFSVFSASYYHRVNADVDAGGKAVWDSKANNQAVGIEIGTKYKIDNDAFIKAKIDNGGRLGLGYTQTLRKGVKISLAGLFDTTKLNENAHKVRSPARFVGITFGHHVGDTTADLGVLRTRLPWKTSAWANAFRWVVVLQGYDGFWAIMHDSTKSRKQGSDGHRYESEKWLRIRRTTSAAPLWPS